MKRFSFVRQVLVFAMITMISSCSSKMDVQPGPPESSAQLLVQSGEWVTNGGTLVASDGSSLVLNGNDPFLKTVLLYNVTFYANGTAVDTNDPGGLTANGLTWQLTGVHLLVHVNDNNTDKVDAMITSISQYKLVLKVTDFYYYNGITYTGLIQTFGH